MVHAQIQDPQGSRIRVGIRGASGLLGWRLAALIHQTSDMEVSLVAVKKDPTLASVLSILDTEPMVEGLWPSTVHVDERVRVVRELNGAGHKINFEPIDQIPLNKHCDILVDVTSPGVFDLWQERFVHFKGPVILQSGEYPKGRLITLPSLSSVQGSHSHIYRQGDCILTGMMPVLHPITPLGGQLALHVLTQFSDKLGDYPTDLQLAATHIRYDMEEPLRTGLLQLLPQKINLLGISQVPGRTHYTITVQLETPTPVSGSDIRSLLENKARVRVIPEIRSTFELAQGHREALRAFGVSAKPITVFGPDLLSSELSTLHRFWIALDYKPLVALANIDCIRFLVRNMPAMEAMALTDRDMGF